MSRWSDQQIRMRHWVRRACATVCQRCGALALAERGRRRHLTILTYHRILPADRKAAYFAPDLVVTPAGLRSHGRILRQRYEVLPLASALEAWRSSRIPERPMAVLTFDDGYRDNYEYAAPVLAELGLTATFFPLVGLVCTGQLPWYDRLALSLTAWLGRGGRPSPGHPLHLVLPGRWDGNGLAPRVRMAVAAAKRLAPGIRRTLVTLLEREVEPLDEPPLQDRIMTYAQLRALAQAGHEIGSHGLTHDILPPLEDPALHVEVQASRRMLQHHLGQPIRSFCYPNGDTDPRVRRAVAAAGYTCAVTSDPGTNGPAQDAFALRRWFVQEDRLSAPGPRGSAALLRSMLCGLTGQKVGRARRPARQP